MGQHVLFPVRDILPSNQWNPEHVTCSVPFLMTSDVEVELRGPEVSLVSGLEEVGGLRLQEVVGTLWEGRKLVGWEQFYKTQVTFSVTHFFSFCCFAGL